jgi:cell wall-associated NlpC family hydrolase
LSKHRRPSRISRIGHLANSPLQLSIAAGVAGTLSVTGTVIANAADSTTAPSTTPKVKPVAAAAPNTADLSSTTSALALHSAVTSATEQRQHDLARAMTRAAAKRAAARKHAAAKHAAAKRAAATAAHSRSFTSASRGVERMSASAAHALQLAAEAASGAYYTHGGAGPNGFDCSGFVMYVMGKMGISLPHSASAQRSMVRSVSTPQPGDLVFVYNGGGGSVGHVAIYAGGGYWWEAANPSVGVGKHRAWSSHVSYGRVL